MAYRSPFRQLFRSTNDAVKFGVFSQATTRFLGASSLVIILTLLTKVAATGKELLIASRLGTSPQVDIFLQAFLVPSIFLNLVSVCFALCFLPHFVKAGVSSRSDSAHVLYSGAMLFLLGVCCACIGLLILLRPAIVSVIAPGFDQTASEATGRCLFILAPLFPAYCVTALWSAILTTYRRYVAVTVAPIITSLVLFLAVAFIPAGHLGSIQLALATTLGGCLETLFIGITLAHAGFAVLPSVNPAKSGVWAVFQDSATLTLSQLVMVGIPLFNQSLATRLGPGSVAILNYSNKVPAIIAQLGANIASIVILPRFAQLSAENNWLGLKQAFKQYIVSFVTALVPLTIVLCFASQLLAVLLFRRGKVSSSDAHLVGTVQMYYLMQLPFYLPGIISARLLITLKANHLLIIMGIANLIITVCASTILIGPLGVAGIAASTSLMYAIGASGVSLLAWKKLQQHES